MDALIEASPLPIIALDRDAKVRTWNPAAEAVFGWSEEEVVGKAPPVLASGEMKREFAQARDGCLKFCLRAFNCYGTNIFSQGPSSGCLRAFNCYGTQLFEKGA